MAHRNLLSISGSRNFLSQKDLLAPSEPDLERERAQEQAMEDITD